MEPIQRMPNLVASTGDTYNCSIAESGRREEKLCNPQPGLSGPNGRLDEGSNYFKSAQWTPDGTSLISSSADNTIRTFILPPTLLDNPVSSIDVIPYTIHNYPTSINCVVPYPHFDLSETTTTLYLSALNDLPIRLTNSLSETPLPLSTYNLISPTTETYQTPSSLLWSSPGTHFLTGTDCLISLFDISRNGEGPVTRMPTIPSKRHKMKGGGVGMRGIVSTLSVQQSSAGEKGGVLAAGTWTRWIGLYDMAGMGGTVATWSIAEAADLHAKIGGTGVTQTLWSSCGRYLYVVERKSKGVLVFDVRVTGQLVAWLEGREADTNQRLGVDLFEAEAGVEIWAGGTDGTVRVWEGVGKAEGGVERSWEWRAHDDPITSTALHTTGTVAATCSGQRSFVKPTEEMLRQHEQEEELKESEDAENSVGSRSWKSSTSRSSSPFSYCSDTEAVQRKHDNSIKVWSL